MKKLWVGIAFALLAAVGRAETKVSCNGVTAVGACDEVTTATFDDIYVTVQCATASTSEVVIESKYCASCEWVRFPKVGDPPITNIGSTPGKPARTFRFPRKTYAIRGNVLTRAAGTLYVYVSYE